MPTSDADQSKDQEPQSSLARTHVVLLFVVYSGGGGSCSSSRQPDDSIDYRWMSMAMLVDGLDSVEIPKGRESRKRVDKKMQIRLQRSEIYFTPLLKLLFE